MKVPKKMEPQPLYDAIVRLGYSSDLDRPSLIRNWASVLIDIFPQMDAFFSAGTEGDGPEPGPIPGVRFFDQDFSVTVQESMLTIRTVSDYPGWSAVRLVAARILEGAATELPGTDEIVRISMNYINYFENTLTLNDVLRDSVAPLGGIMSDRNAVRSLKNPVPPSNIGHDVMVSDGISMDSSGRTGVILDIMAWVEERVHMENVSVILSSLDEIHRYEKRLFAGLIHPGVLEEITKEWEEIADE